MGRCRASPNPAPPHPPTRLETDLADATHIYVASLCMGDELLDALWARLRSGSAPHLRVFASLREVRCTLHALYTAYSPRRRNCISQLHSRKHTQQTLCPGELLLYHMLQVRAAPACTEIAEVEMTWNEEDEAGQMVYVYRV